MLIVLQSFQCMVFHSRSPSPRPTNPLCEQKNSLKSLFPPLPPLPPIMPFTPTCVMSRRSPPDCDGPADKAQRCPYLPVCATAAAARHYLICM